MRSDRGVRLRRRSWSVSCFGSWDGVRRGPKKARSAREYVEGRGVSSRLTFRAMRGGSEGILNDEEGSGLI